MNPVCYLMDTYAAGTAATSPAGNDGRSATPLPAKIRPDGARPNKDVGPTRGKARPFAASSPATDRVLAFDPSEHKRHAARGVAGWDGCRRATGGRWKRNRLPRTTQKGHTLPCRTRNGRTRDVGSLGVGRDAAGPRRGGERKRGRWQGRSGGGGTLKSNAHPSGAGVARQSGGGERFRWSSRRVLLVCGRVEDLLVRCRAAAPTSSRRQRRADRLPLRRDATPARHTCLSDNVRRFMTPRELTDR